MKTNRERRIKAEFDRVRTEARKHNVAWPIESERAARAILNSDETIPPKLTLLRSGKLGIWDPQINRYDPV